MQTGIHYGLAFEELEACAAAGANMVSWLRGEYSRDEMVTILAWRRLHGLIANHVEDASQDEAERKAKKKRG